MNKKFFASIGQNDLCLAVFFAVLLVHLFLSMIFPLTDVAEKTGLDVVTRTATAVLAGYFVSKGFTEKKIPAIVGEKQTRLKFQTFIVAIVGTVTLGILLLVRYTDGINYSAATISQVRDLYLASVAFLMGTA